MHRQLLYLSHLVPSASYDVFAGICHVSRAHNQALGLGGVLLFDGHRFCQRLQGPADVVQATWDRIRRDTRHEFVILLSEGDVGAANSTHWQSGYCEPEALDCFEGPEALRGEAALTAFDAIVTRADLAP